MKKKKTDLVYISGKITDPDPKRQKKNLQKFDDKEMELKGIWKTIFNPTILEGEKHTYEQLLGECLVFIFKNKPDMYMLDNWQDSGGAKLERECAKLLGLNIYYEKEPDTIRK